MAIDAMHMWAFVDKGRFHDGPWMDEPDKVQWIDPDTDLDCLAIRNVHFGTWCGYVGVDQDHPAFAFGYSQPLIDSVRVHGGLTYSGISKTTGKIDRDICHSPESGRPLVLWWFGFDCGHAYDHMPLMMFPPMEGVAYRDLNYVIGECTRLAWQLKSLVDPEKFPVLMEQRGAHVHN